METMEKTHTMQAAETKGPSEPDELLEKSRPFVSYLVEWHNGLEPLDLESEMVDAARVAVLAVDVTRGFCREGALASERVGAIVPPIEKLFRRAHELGVGHFVLPYDAHTHDAVEFACYPPHAMADDTESETVEELGLLPFSGEFTMMPKNSISSHANGRLDAWLDEHPEVDTFIVTGDCTDLCTYQLAMHLRTRANEFNRRVRVILPEDCVQTYDMPVDVAGQIGGVPHDGDLLHLIFLYHMMLNGVEVVSRVL